ncbi:MAG: pyridoxamine 5'-phosphate oxidase family protein [Candidatus Eremiobacteraeota bacterium]|nr:pyridoxamine 5'-phosphate oxidase family protein [Candidatus Eremiobacteraeota bacterium]MBC5802545.1 pyridoxamine 5'-phosphate oxidase family protein [Candidatus Eremiobacteraeota bacterium]MBC5821906.1 pyridoxamine 5'-phosphate oxidase family protein [Candidatus Eremiobacteraeota bacterium]
MGSGLLSSPFLTTEALTKQTAYVKNRTDRGRVRTTLRRHPERALAERGDVNAILDEALVAHVGFIDDGAPVVIPTTYARIGDCLYLHGAVGGRLAQTLAAAEQICVTVTVLDGLVLARSAFHHSMNYRSVVVFGKPRAVTDPAEKERAFAALVEHIVPGRSADTRSAAQGELSATGVIALDLSECSAKSRCGPPVDASADVAAPYWAGVLPARLVFGEPLPDDRAQGMPLPPYLRGYERPAPRTATTPDGAPRKR